MKSCWRGARVFVFVFAVSLAAFLSFTLQLTTAKMLLPVFGGAPSVWNACMLFFQAGLLAAYAYAHYASVRFDVRQNALLHLLLMLTPAICLPFALPSTQPTSVNDSPVLGVLWMLLAMAGLPYFFAAATSPTLQRWYSHGNERDPYFLFAASNAGSLAALLGYVTLIEPRWSLSEQARLWAIAYAALFLSIAICAAFACTVRPLRESTSIVVNVNAGLEVVEKRPILAWTGLAFVPSSLMLSVTSYLSSEIAPVPLLWVATLAIYLLSYIIAFVRLPRLFDHVLAWGLVLALAAEARLFLAPVGNTPFSRLVPHLLLFFVIATACHRELSRRRPPPRYLTAYYFWIALGGMLGGVFNALVAPIAFDRFLELPAVLVVAALLSRPPIDLEVHRRFGRFAWGFVLLPAVTLLLPLNEWLGATPPVRFAAAVMFALFSAERPPAFALALALMFAVEPDRLASNESTILRSRNFFGILSVRDDHVENTRRLVHGATDHGMQRRGPDSSKWQVPQHYYYPTGPIGRVFAAYGDTPIVERVGVVGLGVGSLACYGRAGDDYTFFEINPEIVRLAQDPNYFTHLQECPATVRVVLGDARQSLVREPPNRFGLLIVDAFSGDAIPVHLMTREALELMRDRVSPNGIIALHVSNRYLNLEPVVAATAEAAGLHNLSRFETYGEIGAQELSLGKTASHWIVLARQKQNLDRLARIPGWRPAVSRTDIKAWTDDYSDLWKARR
jgi:hypothetical protein